MGNRWESGTVASAVMRMRKRYAIEVLHFEKALPKMKLSQKTRYDDALSFWAEEAIRQRIRISRIRCNNQKLSNITEGSFFIQKYPVQSVMGRKAEREEKI